MCMYTNKGNMENELRDNQTFEVCRDYLEQHTHLMEVPGTPIGASFLKFELTPNPT